MNMLTEWAKLIESNSIFENKTHLEHPEDLVLMNGINGANIALKSLIDTIKNPKNIALKWDGYPAIIFGHDSAGNFSIMDKHMFNKKDGSGRNIFSPKQFVEYDKNRGVVRDSLNKVIKAMWPSLELASRGAKGYYWGELLFSAPLKAKNGVYSFKANPNGITYQVDVNSDIGRLLKNKVAGIAVHQYIDPNALNTNQAVSLEGTIGQLENNSRVALLSSSLPSIPKIKLDKSLQKEVESAISANRASVEKLLDNAPGGKKNFSRLLTTFINKKVVSGDLTGLVNSFAEDISMRNMSDDSKKVMIDYLRKNKKGITGLFTIWAALYKLKIDIVDQIEDGMQLSSVKGYLDSGQPSHEGYVSQGIKLVNRLGFSRQNLSGNR